MTMTTEEFVGAVRRLVDHWLPAREIVEASYKARLEVGVSEASLRLDAASLRDCGFRCTPAVAS